MLCSVTIIETSPYRVTLFQKGKVISEGGKNNNKNKTKPTKQNPQGQV